MAVSYAAILGGVVTAIGTSTNLTISGLLVEAGMRPLGLFEPTPIGLPIAVAGVATLIAISARLLPDRSTAGGDLADSGRDFTVSMRVAPGGAADGPTVTDAGLRSLQGVFLVEIERDGRSIAPVAPDERLQAGDLLTFVGRVGDVVDLQRMPGLHSAQARQIGSLAGTVHSFYQVVVGSGADLVGQTLKGAGLPCTLRRNRDRHPSRGPAHGREAGRRHGSMWATRCWSLPTRRSASHGATARTSWS